jgi:hypothetical protein
MKTVPRPKPFKSKEPLQTVKIFLETLEKLEDWQRALRRQNPKKVPHADLIKHVVDAFLDEITSEGLVLKSEQIEPPIEPITDSEIQSLLTQLQEEREDLCSDLLTILRSDDAGWRSFLRNAIHGAARGVAKDERGTGGSDG